MGLVSLFKNIDFGPSKDELIARDLCTKIQDARNQPFGDQIAVRAVRDMFSRFEEKKYFGLMTALRDHLISDHPRVKWHFLHGPPTDIAKETLMARSK